MIKHIHKNNLCCEAIVRRMPNKELLLVCQCDDVTEPAPKNRVYFWHSKDDGNTWDKRTLLCKEDGRATYATEVSVIGNEIRCYITYHNGYFLDFECDVLVSIDNGYTWENKGKIPCIDGFCFIRGLLILPDNTHILPYQNYNVSKKKEAELLASETKKRIWDSNIDFVETGVLISKDNGKTYTKGKPILMPLKDENDKFKWLWTEPSVVNLSDGSLAMLLRVDHAGYLYRSDSKDNGNTWSKPYITNIKNPNNKPKLIKMNDGRIALLNTFNSGDGFEYRTPLEIWISSDDMKTWEVKKTLLDFPAWISYPDGFIEDNKVYVSIEFNRHDIYFIKEEL